MGSNPWDVLILRRKLKNYRKHGFQESMKNLHKLRSLALDRKTLIATEVTRTLVWLAQRTKDAGEDEEQRKFNKMVRFLIKEHRNLLGVGDKKDGGGES